MVHTGGLKVKLHPFDASAYTEAQGQQHNSVALFPQQRGYGIPDPV
jgi:hypothetical protein